MNEAQSSGILTLTSPTQVALFEEEIKGQLSDGYWENTRPYDHWKFWCHVDVKLGKRPSCRAFTYLPYKSRYGLERLITIIGDRMLKIGRMANRDISLHAVKAAEYMPDSFDEWCFTKVSLGFPVHAHMELVTNDIAKAFYDVGNEYTVRDLWHDLKQIKLAMRSVND